MSLADFRNGQSHIEARHAASPVFESLVPLVQRMYGCVRDLAQSNGSPTMGRLFMLCHREFLVAATLIQRGLPYDAAANTRRAIEIATVALALKRDPDNAAKWLQAPERQARWDARYAGNKPKSFQPVHFPEVNADPLYKTLQDYFGMSSDMYVHFTPEFFGIQSFHLEPKGGGATDISLDYFAGEREVLQHGIVLCGVHARILLVFDACFDNVVTADKGWQMLKATFDPLGGDLLKSLPPDEDQQHP